jgi:hypothetical protein
VLNLISGGLIFHQIEKYLKHLKFYLIVILIPFKKKITTHIKSILKKNASKLNFICLNNIELILK